MLSQTGNRRFWPLKMLAPIDLEKLARDRLQLWGEAAHYQSQGEAVSLDESLWADAAVEQEARRVKDPWEGSCPNLSNMRVLDPSRHTGDGKEIHAPIVERDIDQERVATGGHPSPGSFYPGREAGNTPHDAAGQGDAGAQMETRIRWQSHDRKQAGARVLPLAEAGRHVKPCVLVLKPIGPI